MGTILQNGNSNGVARGTSLLASGLFHPVRILRNAARTVANWSARSRQRRALALLNEDLLRDIGVNRYHAKREAEKPFWRD